MQKAEKIFDKSPKRISHTCENPRCGKEFTNYFSRSSFCSRKCYLYVNGNLSTQICSQCGKRFQRSLSLVRHRMGKVFCSQDCWHEFQKATRRVCKECHHWYSANMERLHHSFMCQRIKKTIKAVEQKADDLRMNLLCARLNRAPDGEEALYYYRTLEDGSVFDPEDKIGSSPFQIIKARLPTADDW